MRYQCGQVEKATSDVHIMNTDFRIAYGYNRSEKQFSEHDIFVDKFFIDNDGTGRKELEDLFKAVKAGVTVVVLQKKDFGNGARAKQVQTEIEALGATVEIATDGKSTGRDTSVNFTDDQLKWACALWNDRKRDKGVVLRRITEKTGQTVDRHQMNYLCRRKQKRLSGESS